MGRYYGDIAIVGWGMGIENGVEVSCTIMFLVPSTLACSSIHTCFGYSFIAIPHLYHITLYGCGLYCPAG